MSCECFRTLDGSWMDGERERKELTCYCCSPFFLSFSILNGYLSMTNVDYYAMRWTNQKLIKLKPGKVLDTNIRWVQTALPIEHIQQTTAYKIDQAVDLPRSNSHTTYSTHTVRGATINASDENARENVQQKNNMIIHSLLEMQTNIEIVPTVADNSGVGGGGGCGRSELVVFSCLFAFFRFVLYVNRATNKVNTKCSRALPSK